MAPAATKPMSALQVAVLADRYGDKRHKREMRAEQSYFGRAPSSPGDAFSAADAMLKNILATLLLAMAKSHVSTRVSRPNTSEP